MSIEQMLAHVSDQIKITLQIKTAEPYGSAFTRTISKFFALYVPIPFPKNLKTFKEIDPSLGIMTQPTTFDSDKNTLIDLLEKYRQTPDSQHFTHPAFGRLTKDELGKLTYLHLDHHLRQFGV